MTIRAGATKFQTVLENLNRLARTSDHDLEIHYVSFLQGGAAQIHKSWQEPSSNLSFNRLLVSSTGNVPQLRPVHHYFSNTSWDL